MTRKPKDFECDSCGAIVPGQWDVEAPDACPECGLKVYACEGCIGTTVKTEDDGLGNVVGFCDACRRTKIICAKCHKAEPAQFAWGDKPMCRACHNAAPPRERFRREMEDLLRDRAIGAHLHRDILRHLDDACAHYESMLSPSVPVRRVPENVGGDWRAAS